LQACFEGELKSLEDIAYKTGLQIERTSGAEQTIFIEEHRITLEEVFRRRDELYRVDHLNADNSGLKIKNELAWEKLNKDNRKLPPGSKRCFALSGRYSANQSNRKGISRP